MENPFDIIFQKLERIEQQIQELNKAINHLKFAPSVGAELMNIHQVADYLHLSVQTVYRFTSKLEIPHMKKGKRLYFRREEIDVWLINSKRKTREEIEADAGIYLQKRKRF